jgi:hypothetical protein
MQMCRSAFIVTTIATSNSMQAAGCIGSRVTIIIVRRGREAAARWLGIVALVDDNI